MLSASIKFLIFLMIIFSFSLFSLPLYFFYSFNRLAITKCLVFNMHQHCRLLTRLLGIKVVTFNQHHLRHCQLNVANHLSYLDVIILGALRPMAFVTSVEIKNTPFLGHLARLAGSLFVERRSRDNLSQEQQEIEKALKAGISVTIFPEATTTNGEEIKMFKRPLFASAIKANVLVAPICLNYQKIDEEKIYQHNRDHLFWYGDMTFFAHFWGVLKLKKIEVKVNVESPIETIGQNVEGLSLYARKLITHHFQEIKNLKS